MQILLVEAFPASIYLIFSHDSQASWMIEERRLSNWFLLHREPQSAFPCEGLKRSSVLKRIRLMARTSRRLRRCNFTNCFLLIGLAKRTASLLIKRLHFRGVNGRNRCCVSHVSNALIMSRFNSTRVRTPSFLPCRMILWLAHST